MKVFSRALVLVTLFMAPAASFADANPKLVLKPNLFGGHTTCIVLDSTADGSLLQIARSLGGDYYDTSSVKWIPACKVKPLSENSPGVISTRVAELLQKRSAADRPASSSRIQPDTLSTMSAD